MSLSYDAFVSYAAKGKGVLTIVDGNIKGESTAEKVGKAVKLVAKREPGDKFLALQQFRASLEDKLIQNGKMTHEAEEIAHMLLEPCMRAGKGVGAIDCATIKKIDKIVTSGNMESQILAADIGGLIRRDSFANLLDKDRLDMLQGLLRKLQDPKKCVEFLPVVGTVMTAVSATTCGKKALALGRLYRKLDELPAESQNDASVKLLRESLKVAQNHYIAQSVSKSVGVVTSVVTSLTTAVDGEFIIDPLVETAVSAYIDTTKVAESAADKATKVAVDQAASQLTDIALSKPIHAKDITVGPHIKDNLGDFIAIRALVTYLAMGDRRGEIEAKADTNAEVKNNLDELLHDEFRRLEVRGLLFPDTKFDALGFDPKLHNTERPLSSSALNKTPASEVDWLREIYLTFCREDAEI